SVGVALEIVNGEVRSARIAAGGVGTKPWRFRASEAALVGRRPHADAWRTAADRATDGARALSGNGYKVELLRRTIVRALEMAAR
ncbi:MAG: xanthine dehydrogenase family protein subunit, partial [Candidatus Eremiobacteraeota bacterium]|nr:xanthine dehydrogenase family protein subunit [Candidatus Eremiobacteraeota bacterium]